MLSAPALDLSFIPDNDDAWKSSTPPPRRSANGWGYGSYGVTNIGRGFDWDNKLSPKSSDSLSFGSFITDPSDEPIRTPTSVVQPKPALAIPPSMDRDALSISSSPAHSRPSSPLAMSPLQRSGTGAVDIAVRPPSRSSSMPRPRRRSSQQRVSLIAGRLSFAPATESPSTADALAPALPGLSRAPNGTSSYLSSAASTAPPSPNAQDAEPFSPSGRHISAFKIEKEIGRGAYGVVKQAREKLPDDKLGPPLIIKKIVKSRILADCWKKHPLHGTIPIEIYVLSAISNSTYILPAKRPWSPFRPGPTPEGLRLDPSNDAWIEGAVYKGHPNICPMLEFFEDSHYYYLVSPSSAPEEEPGAPPHPSDLFDLVEAYPNGLPPWFIRTYLGQMADALCFLHSKGIVHRDIKDENVVLGKDAQCILIDFGSSGLVKKGGWDTFSGTLDYAGPEILRGERYEGKEQDVWAFGVVAYVLLVGECPFTSPADAQEGLASPFTPAAMALDERCADGKYHDGEEADGGGALGDAADLVRACLQVDVNARPTFERILESRFLSGGAGWVTDHTLPS